MEDQFDDELRNRIRKVFDEHSDPAADEGWKLLLDKLPGDKKRSAMVWIWLAAAAGLLLFIGLGWWSYYGSYKPGMAVIRKPDTSKNKTLQAGASQPATVSTPGKAAEPGSNPGIRKSGRSSVVSGANLAQYHNIRLYPVKPATPVQQNPGSVTAPSTSVSGVNSNSTFATISKDSVKTTAGQTASALTAAVKPLPPQGTIAANKPDSAKKQKRPLFADDMPIKKKNNDGPSKIRMGVYASTYVSYANGSSNQGNLGAGLTAELRITKHLKLVSGLGITHNSLIFGNSLPTGVSQNTVIPSYSSYSVAPTPSAASAFTKEQVTIASVPAFKDYDASMYAIDVPVNLKYDFTSKLYLMAGFSSGTYLDESYTYKYNYPAVSSLQQIQNSTIRQSFNSYYFGKIVNVAFGFGYPMGRNNLIIEPFLKYPLDGLGSQNIRFGSGGINLKFNFPPAIR
jgi:hypothetical protein